MAEISNTLFLRMSIVEWSDNFLNWGLPVAFMVGMRHGGGPGAGFAVAAYGVYHIFGAWNEIADEEEFRKGEGLFPFFGLNAFLFLPSYNLTFS